MASLQQTDIAAAAGVISACSGLSAASVVAGSQCSLSGTPGSNADVVTDPKNTLDNILVAFQSDSTFPGTTGWPGGTYTVRLNVTSGNANLELDAIYICRLNASNISQGTVGSATSLAINLGTPGVVSVNVTGSAQAAAATDTRYFVLGFKSLNTGNPQSITIKLDQRIDTPFGVPYTPPRRARRQWTVIRRRKRRRPPCPVLYLPPAPYLPPRPRRHRPPPRRPRRRRFPWLYPPAGKPTTAAVLEALAARALVEEQGRAAGLVVERLTAAASLREGDSGTESVQEALSATARIVPTYGQ